MTVDQVTEVLLRLLTDFENVLVENFALKAVMQFAVPRNLAEPSLPQQVTQLLRDAGDQPIHAQFEELRAQIRQAVREQNLAELADAVATARGIVN